MRQLTDLQKLSQDILNGTVKEFSSISDAENKIRETVVNACEGEWNFYKFQDNKWKVYEIMSEVLDVDVETVLEDEFSDFVDTVNDNLGDRTDFEVEDEELFRVASIARGTTDVRRQFVDNGVLTVPTEKLAIKIYAEWDKFMAGRINWAKMVAKVGKSMSNKIGTMIYNTIYSSYDVLGTDLKKTGVFDVAKLRELIEQVEAGTGMEAVIYGTKTALGKINSGSDNQSDKMKDAKNALGYYGEFEGTSMVRLPQARKGDGTTGLAIDNGFLLVAPSSHKIVKMRIEGQSEVYDLPSENRKDQQIEHFFAKRVGIGTIASKVYGIYRIG